VNVKPKISVTADSTLDMDGEEKTKGGAQAEREETPAGDKKARLLFGKKTKQAKGTEQQPSSQNTTNADSSEDKKFVPTCSVCGEKHWPFHPLVRCTNLRKAKAKAKEERKTRAEARKKAKAEAKTKARVERNARAEAMEKANYEARLRAIAEERQEAAAERVKQIEQQLRVEVEASDTGSGIDTVVINGNLV